MLDAETLLLLIDRINIGETRKVDGKKVRDIEIVYNYVGNVDILSETAETTALPETEAAYGEAV